MNTKTNLLFTFFLLVFVGESLSCQPAYSVEFKKEITHLASAVALNGVGLVLQYYTPDISLADQNRLSPNNINRIDQFSIGKRSHTADVASDILAYSSAFLPCITYLAKWDDRTWRATSVMYVETVLYNAAFTNIVKYSSRRKRPYVYSDVLGESEVFDFRGSASFYSGHTSFASSNAWFAALIFQQAFPESSWIPVFYGSAVVLPLSTGIARIYAGEHFPTDVLVGYMMGAATAIAVVKSHKNKRLKVESNGTSVKLSFQLD